MCEQAVGGLQWASRQALGAHQRACGALRYGTGNSSASRSASRAGLRGEIVASASSRSRRNRILTSN